MGKCPRRAKPSRNNDKAAPLRRLSDLRKKLMSIPAKCRRHALPRSSGQRVTVTRFVRRERVLLPAAEQWDERAGRHDMHQLPF